MKRDKAYLRKQRKRAINRKYKIREFTWGKESTKDYYEHNPKGELSKGKVHCSCSLCRLKSYDELSHRDKKNLLYLINQLNSYKVLDIDLL